MCVGEILQYASTRLKADKEVVLKAVKSCGANLQYASEELKNDKEVVLESIRLQADAFNYASQELKEEIGEILPLNYLTNYLKSIK